jgi:oligopeptide transport system substrate-binding protein
MLRLAFMFAAVLTLALFLAGCDTPSDSSTDATGQQVLRRGNGGDPGTLDPALAEDVHAFNVLLDLYEGLVAESANGGLVPGVAQSWSVTDDGHTYVFKLRGNARWSNGDPVVASDFVRAFRRVSAPETLSSYGFLLEPIKNFNAIKAGNMPVSDLGVHAIDTQTLALHLREPVSHFLSVLAMPIAFPMHASALVPESFSDAERFVGNGAYVLRERQVLGPIRLRRNDLYWNADSVSIEDVEYLPIVDEGLELNMYRAGELDITQTIPSSQFAQLKEESPGEVRIAPSLAFYCLAFDLSESPLNNKDLRRALSMAINRRKLVELIGRGEQPAFGIVPSGVANHGDAAYVWRDLDEDKRIDIAQEAYADAGFDVATPLRIKLTYDVGGIHERIALAVSGMWQEALGVEVQLEKKEWKFFLETRDNRSDWQIMRFSWFGDYNDPMTFLEIFRSDSPQNLPLYNNPDYDKLLNKASIELDSHTRTELLADAEQTLIEDYPIAPLYFYVSKHMVKPRIKGFDDNVLDRHPSRFLSFYDNN